MLIRTPPELRWSDVTPRRIYANRRRFLASLTGAAAAPGMLQAFAREKLGPLKASSYNTSEKQTPYEAATQYNNFYEFGTDKSDPSRNAHTLKTRPWTVKIEGACNKPQTIDIDAVLKLAPLEERIYRLRCVEAWSMVIPWIGFPLSELLKRAEPTAQAKYVAFESLFDGRQMPQATGLPFPYKEGLRMDEAMHPLTLLCTGMYGEVLPNQNGAPVRIVVPWKYGFKSIKSITRIRFVGGEPPCTWKQMNSREYGFYSNVNPEVDHPRWTQARERRIGEFSRRQTLMFNGYGDQVASLYTGLDLKKNY